MPNTNFTLTTHPMVQEKVQAKLLRNHKRKLVITRKGDLLLCLSLCYYSVVPKIDCCRICWHTTSGDDAVAGRYTRNRFNSWPPFFQITAGSFT